MSTIQHPAAGAAGPATVTEATTTQRDPRTRSTRASRKAERKAEQHVDGRKPKRSGLLTAVMIVFVVYSFAPLFYLLVNSTKTQASLLSTFGLWFGGDFNLWQNIVDTVTYNDGIFLQWFGNTLLYVVVGAGGATLSPRSRATAWRSSSSRGAVRSSPSSSAPSRSPARRWRSRPSCSSRRSA